MIDIDSKVGVAAVVVTEIVFEFADVLLALTARTL
jgi:hypothetical protein